MATQTRTIVFPTGTNLDVSPFFRKKSSKNLPEPCCRTPLGALYRGDCMALLPHIRSSCIDLVFADPPFNIGKIYGGGVDDNRADEDYLKWCYSWLTECIRVLKPGGSLFLYNLPRWNVQLGAFLMQQGLMFRHWIAVNIRSSLPIPGRLYPAHYSLLYYSKGKPKTFRRIRTPIEVCRHCGGELRDYGGHRKAMNPKGVNLMDVWNDIAPVRHWKFKSRKRKANQLSTKILSRVVNMASNSGDVVLDPFGGSGTTFDVCEGAGRRWIGCEMENCDVIVERLGQGTLHHHPNCDYLEDE